jgi:hypothetical protein
MERIATFVVSIASNVNLQTELGRHPMSMTGRLSVVSAYLALAFVGAIVLGVF